MYNFNSLKDKVAVVTGGAGVIGQSVCNALGSVGAHVVILDLDKSAAVKVANQVNANTGANTLGLETNVLCKSSLLKAKNQIIKQLGTVNLLVNGAGGNSPKATTGIEKIEDFETDFDRSFFGLDVEGFDTVFDLNFKGTLLPSMVFGEVMVKNGTGSILNISSMNSYNPLTKIPAYSAAKAAINNFTQWLAVHFAKTGVRVNAIAPGFFQTKQNRFLLFDKDTGEMTPRGEKIIDNTPMERYGEVEELNGTCLYLLSDLSKFVTGVVIPIDGGYSAFGGV